MRLYDLVKDRLKDPKGVITDNEMLLLNRRDFLYSETSTASALLRLFNSDRVTYEMYSIIDFVHTAVCKIGPTTSVRVYQLSQSMTLPSVAVSSIIGDRSENLRVHAPRGVQALRAKDAFGRTLVARFERQLDSGLAMGDLGGDGDSVDVLFCNASNEAEVSSALKAFEKVKRGFIVIKGYGRQKAPNCGDIILAARLNVHCSLAGFGFCLAM